MRLSLHRQRTAAGVDTNGLSSEQPLRLQEEAQETSLAPPEAAEITEAVTEESAIPFPTHDLSQIAIQPAERLGTPLDLSGSVGYQAENAPEDVLQVQTRLQHLGFEACAIDGQYTPHLAAAIQAFQQFFMQQPDGVIEIGSPSHLRLNQLPSATAAQTPTAKTETAAEPAPETDEILLHQTAPPLKLKRHREFVQSIDGRAVDAKLMQTLEEFCKYLIRHQYAEPEIVLLEGMRDRRKAHRWSTAYAIRNDQIPLETLKKLPSGRDADGNCWYREGDTVAQVKRRAADLGLDSPSKPASEGYLQGDTKQLPNEWDDGISNHVIGKAVKVLISWKTEKQGQMNDPTAQDLIKKFGLKRPVPDDDTHFELLQGSPKGEEEHGHRDSET